MAARIEPFAMTPGAIQQKVGIGGTTQVVVQIASLRHAAQEGDQIGFTALGELKAVFDTASTLIPEILRERGG